MSTTEDITTGLATTTIQPTTQPTTTTTVEATTTTVESTTTLITTTPGAWKKTHCYQNTYFTVIPYDKICSSYTPTCYLLLYDKIVHVG